MEKEIPRRIRQDLWIKQEKLIFNAMQEVEKMPADTRLTDAVILLSQAQEKVADFIDSEEGELWRIKNAKPI